MKLTPLPLRLSATFIITDERRPQLAFVSDGQGGGGVSFRGVIKEVVEVRDLLELCILVGNYNGRAESEGEGGSFSFCCLPALCTSKIPGIAKFQEILIAFEQIPAIPAKFRNFFGDKHAM